MNATETTNVQGFITEDHVEEVEAVFGEELADQVRNAPEGTTFLSLLFADFAN